MLYSHFDYYQAMGTADVFREFLQRHGAVIRADLQLLVPLMGDRGVTAAKDISAGQQLMLIPTSICPHMPGEQVRPKGPAMPYFKHRLSYSPGCCRSGAVRSHITSAQQSNISNSLALSCRHSWPRCSSCYTKRLRYSNHVLLSADSAICASFQSTSIHRL